MPSSQWFSPRLALAAVFFVTFLDQISALSAQFCSTLNTAKTDSNSSIYQSNGLCYNQCVDDYAFAILQENDCWCSNDAPGTTTSLSDCNIQCSGYPNDLCGGVGLFGYLALTKSPTATVNAGSTSASSSNAGQPVTVTATATPAVITIVDTLTDPPLSSSSSSSLSLSTSSSSSSPTTLSTVPSSTTSSPSPSSSSTPTWTPTPVTSLETVTGQVRTVTVTPTVPPNLQSQTGVARKSGGGGGLSTGGAVGLTVGLVALVALICSIAYFCIRKRQKERAEEKNLGSRRGSATGLGGPIPSRTMSENSRYILGTDGRQVVETWEPDSRDTSGSRKSRLMPVDPRLDPFAPVYQRGENKSRESVNTIRDDHDYSRRVHQQAPILRATNPDD